jgi:hypothetical protein
MLLQGVREVAALANPTAPPTVSQRAFDRARASSATHADLPAARQIAKELKLNWPEALAVAHAPENEQNKLLALKTKDYYSPVGWLTEARIKYALRLVAGRLGVDTLTKGEYDAERVVLLNADARDWLHGRRLRLPSATAILLATSSWDAAVVLAGLKAFVRSHTIHQVILSPVEVVDRFYEHYGEQPSRKALRAFARGNKLPMSGEGNRPFAEIVTEWRQQRHEHGLPEPRVIKYRLGPGIKRPDYSADVGAARLGEHLYRGKWTGEGRERCVEWVANYLASLPVGAKATAATYEAWRKQNPGAPSTDRFSMHGGWDAVRRNARKQLKAQGPTTPGPTR